MLILGEGTIVAKAGGTSTANPERLERLHSIMTADPRRGILVVSAPGNITEGDVKISRLLETCYGKARKGEDFTKDFEPIRQRYLLIAGDFTSAAADKEAERFVNQTFEGIRDRIWTPGQAVVRGEYGIAKLLAAGWGVQFVDPTEIFKFRDDGELDPTTYALIREKLQKGTGLHIVPGCYGAKLRNKDEIVMFDWGGSDITADLIAEQVGDGHENWTDTDGVKAVDPKILKPEDRQNIPTIPPCYN